VGPDNLLKILSDGEFHSGEEIGLALGVSRAAVWKQLQKLEALELSLESVKGRGYRLPGGIELLAADALREYLPASKAALADRVEIFSQLDSTNAEAARRIAAGSAQGYCCVAEQQTAGRGRRGRQWLSPFARNLYLSLVWEFQNGAAALEGLSLSVGVAVLRAVKSLGVEGVSLKWPNDILLDGKKLAGILLEMQGDPSGLCQVIIGVGLNLDLQRVDTASITQPWADLSGFGLSRNQLLASILVELHQVMAEFAVAGFAGHREEWCASDAYAGRLVAVQLGDNWVSGIAKGVDSGGGLVVDVEGECRTFHGGEVTLRGNG
jgi:BirA family transcriptional regulator, biotin operon repressor / biotin---[acetyl-CoA-carboxylase] ligase